MTYIFTSLRIRILLKNSNYTSLSLHSKYMPLCRNDDQWHHKWIIASCLWLKWHRCIGVVCVSFSGVSHPYILSFLWLLVLYTVTINKHYTDILGRYTRDDINELFEESLVMQNFDHPNVMGLIGVCLDAGPAPYIVLPYMAGIW